jgi:putative transposase
VICAFIASVAGRVGVVPACRALSAHGVVISPRTYHARRSRPPSRRAVRDAWLTSLLRQVFEPGERGRKKPESLYGAVKVWGYLRRQGIGVARCTVERLMRANGWRGNVRGRRTVRTTVADPAHPRHPDLVHRDFRAQRPGQLLVADFTYVPMAGGGFGYAAFVIDVFAGTIAGWECSLSKTTAFVQRAIGQAAQALRRAAGGQLPGPVIHHSDAGSQYTSVRFAESLMLAGMAPSVGTVGDAYDNALAETTIGLYKSECTADGSPFRDGPITALGNLDKITAAWVHWYNTARLMHRLGLRPPAEADAEYWNSQH